MHKSFEFIVILLLAAVSLNTYAIQVNVQSSSKEVAALGFTVNGADHGGAGRNYSKKDMPFGIYTFGVRVGGIFGTDVGCVTRQGQKSITLNRDSTAVLNYDGRQCSLIIYPGVRS